MATLKTEYDRFEARISKMTDDKYDERITAEMYDKKLKEYKSKQADILQQMNDHSSADKEYHLTASRLLDICKRAESIFKSSEPAEKRVFLNFILPELGIKRQKPSVYAEASVSRYRKSARYSQLGCLSGLEPGPGVPQTPVLPLHHRHHQNKELVKR